MKKLITVVLAVASCTAIGQPPSPVAPEILARYSEQTHQAVAAPVDEWLTRRDMSTTERLAKVRALAEAGNYVAQDVLIQIYDSRCHSPNNDLCVAVPKDVMEAQKWRYEIAAPERLEVPYFYKSRPQGRLATDHYFAAGPKYSPDNEDCKAALNYAEQSYANGNRCVASLLKLMYGLGHCVKADEAVRFEWSKRSVGCPVY